MSNHKLADAVNNFIDAKNISFNSFDLTRIKKIQKSLKGEEFKTANDVIKELKTVKALSESYSHADFGDLEKEIERILR